MQLEPLAHSRNRRNVGTRNGGAEARSVGYEDQRQRVDVRSQDQPSTDQHCSSANHRTRPIVVGYISCEGREKKR
jgi:hypothetical protein